MIARTRIPKPNQTKKSTFASCSHVQENKTVEERPELGNPGIHVPSFRNFCFCALGAEGDLSSAVLSYSFVQSPCLV